MTAAIYPGVRPLRGTHRGRKEWSKCVLPQPVLPLAELAHILPTMLSDATLRVMQRDRVKLCS